MKKGLLTIITAILPFVLFAQIYYPMDGTPLNICSDIFADSGGASENYSSNENLTTTICPTSPGTVIELSLTNLQLGMGDTLCFFDGSSTSVPLLACAHESSGSQLYIVGSALSPEGCITVTFNSDASNEAAGWEAYIDCVEACQGFTTQIASTLPAISPPDTGYIDICLGDTILFSGTADFYQNNINYTQANNTSIFEWKMGDGTTLEGEDVMHVFQEPGGYYVNLQVTDILGCTSDNILTQRIRVTGIDDFSFETDHVAGACAGDTITLINTSTVDNNFPFANHLLNIVNEGIPDGNGAVYNTSFLINNYPQNSVITSPSDIINICMNIEHSWMHDLEFELVCPSGSSLILQQQTFNGAVFLGEPFEDDEGEYPIPGIGYDYCFSPDATNGTLTEFFLDTGVTTMPAGEYSSFESFSNLIGCPLNGEWELRVRDLWGVDNGYLFSWSLEFQESPNSGAETFTVDISSQGWLDNPAILYNSNDTLIAQVGTTQSFTYQIDFGNGCSADSTIVIEPVSSDSLACFDCNDLVVDAGPDVAIDCLSPYVELNAENSSNGEYFEYQWTTTDGQIISGSDALTIIVASSGTYVFTLTSTLTDCILSDSVLVLPTQNTPIANAGDDFPFPCNVTEVVLDGTNSTSGPEFTFLWITSDGEISSGINTLSPIITEPGTYLLQVTNSSNGCVNLDTLIVTDQVILDIMTVNATCDNTDGSAIVSIPPGTNNPSFAWSDGQTQAMAQNLAQGWYSVTVSYNNDCSDHMNVYVDEELSCKVQIIGRVINDNITEDCIEDGTSNRENEIMLHLMPDDVYTYTNHNGVYNFVTDNGDHSIEIILPPYLESLCPTDGIFNLSLPDNGTISQGNDFYIDYISGAFDLSISCFNGIARPGMEHKFFIGYCNEGDEAKTGTVTFIHDPVEANISASPLPQGWTYDSATSTATWTFTDLQPGECLTQLITLDIPESAMAGDILSGSIEISSTGDDFDPANNFKSWNQIVMTSFDPNDKQVFVESSEGSFGGMIYESDTTLSYQIRFQNTGTDTAFAVLIRDTLDSDLDVTTIRPGISSHPYSLEFERNDILIFNFENIMLPDSNTNLAASQGYVTFSIDRNLDIPIGTEIENSAAIYFDYNEPVITNQVVNVFSEFVSSKELIDTRPSLQIIPNPNNGNFQVFYHLKHDSDAQILVFDIYGNMIREVNPTTFQMAGDHTKEVSINSLPNGIYFLHLKTSKGNAIQKMIKVD